MFYIYARRRKICSRKKTCVRLFLLSEYSTPPTVINKKLSIKTNKSAAIKHENASARGKSFLLLLACAFSADMSSR
jgi:hypothetical protein